MKSKSHARGLVPALFVVAMAVLASCQTQVAPTPTSEPPTERPPATEVAPTATPEATASATLAATDTPQPSPEPQPSATVEAEALPTEENAAAESIFTVFGEGPVVPHGPSGSWDGQFTDPGAVVYHDGAFHMFHNGFAGWPAPVGIAYSTSPDGYKWTRVQEDPVFRGDDLDYAGLTVLASDALVLEDGTWVLYFYTWDDRTWPSSGSSIGRATAPDPLGPWTADPQPVLTAGGEGAWDQQAVRAPSVVRGEDGYVMYYAGFDGQQSMIGMATSPDGVQWTKYDDPSTVDAPFAESDPIFGAGAEDSWDAGNVFNPRVVRAPGATGGEDAYIMVYSAAPRLNVSSTLGYATSTDSVQWQRAAEPVLEYTAVPGGRAIWFSALEYQDGIYFLFFELGTGGQTEVYLATAGALP